MKIFLLFCCKARSLWRTFTYDLIWKSSISCFTHLPNQRANPTETQKFCQAFCNKIIINYINFSKNLQEVIIKWRTHRLPFKSQRTQTNKFYLIAILLLPTEGYLIFSILFEVSKEVEMYELSNYKRSPIWWKISSMILTSKNPI